MRAVEQQASTTLADAVAKPLDSQEKCQVEWLKTRGKIESVVRSLSLSFLRLSRLVSTILLCMFIRRCPSYFGTFLIIFEAPKCPECVDEYDDIKLDVLLFGFSPFSRLSMRTVMGRWYCVLDRSMTAAASWFDSTAVHTLGSMTVCLFVGRCILLLLLLFSSCCI